MLVIYTSIDSLNGDKIVILSFLQMQNIFKKQIVPKRKLRKGFFKVIKTLGQEIADEMQWNCSGERMGGGLNWIPSY